MLGRHSPAPSHSQPLLRGEQAPQDLSLGLALPQQRLSSPAVRTDIRRGRDRDVSCYLWALATLLSYLLTSSQAAGLGPGAETKILLSQLCHELMLGSWPATAFPYQGRVKIQMQNECLRSSKRTTSTGEPPAVWVLGKACAGTDILGHHTSPSPYTPFRFHVHPALPRSPLQFLPSSAKP